MNISHATQALLAASLLVGSSIAIAADQETPLALKFDTQTRELPSQHYNDVCPVRVTRAHDDRQNKLTFGLKPDGALLSGDITQWVTDAESDLKRYGVPVVLTDDESVPDSGLLIKSSVTRTYIWHVGTKMFSMVAIKIDYYNKDGLLEEKYYRAHGDKTNMVSADSEAVDTFNFGINNLLPVMAQDLVSLCKGQLVEKYTYAGPGTVPAPKTGLVDPNKMN